MKYFKHPETGEVFAYEEDGSQDDCIDVVLVMMTAEEVADHIRPKVDHAAVEDAWRDSELALVRRQLEAIEEDEAGEPPVDLLAGTRKQWLGYRGQVSNWQEGKGEYPDSARRPARPV